MLRRRKREHALRLDGDEDDELPRPQLIAPWREQPFAAALRGELRTELETAIDTLPPGLREVFTLREIGGLSVRETAQALGLSESNVKVRHHRARLKLRDELSHRFGDLGRRLQPGHHREEGP